MGVMPNMDASGLDMSANAPDVGSGVLISKGLDANELGARLFDRTAELNPSGSSSSEYESDEQTSQNKRRREQ